MTTKDKDNALTAKLERLKIELGNLILEKIGRPLETNRIEELATIFPLYGKIPGKKRILVVGLNGHFDNDRKDERQPASKNHPYFTSFENNILKGIDNIEIKYFDLIPVRTAKKTDLKYNFFIDGLRGKISSYIETAHELYDPDLVLTNDVNVSKFITKNLCNMDEDGFDTIVYYQLNTRKIPIILSGHISGLRTIDKYNRIRLLREIYEALNSSMNYLRDNEVKIKQVQRHDVNNCEICKGDIERLMNKMSYRDYEEADGVFKAWKDHVFWTLMGES